MTDTGRVLLTAAILAGSAIGVFAWRVTRLDPAEAERLVGELRLAQMAAVVLAAVGAILIGLAASATQVPGAHLDATLGVAFVVAAGFVLRRHPHEALLAAAIGFLAHALVMLAHRPGLLPPDLLPRWFAIALATCDVYLAAVCWAARRR
ncbi:MAG: hypothetical protein R2752_21000 [Vicinamibacterales bacterium]